MAAHRSITGGTLAPWTVAGGPDPGYAVATRARHHAWLTDARLAERFQKLHPRQEPVYEHMIRALDLVWDCPDDGTVNVVGYCCAGCGASREVAVLAELCRHGGGAPRA